MYKIAILLVCIQACLAQNCNSNAGGIGLGPSLGYGAGLAGYGASLGSSGFSGTGNGDVAVTGELGVGGTTLVVGSVPVSGLVTYGGQVPACGSVTIQGSCSGCGCNSGY